MGSVSRQAVIRLPLGARDARWSLTLGDLADRVAARLPEALVLPAFLEFQPPTRGQSIGVAVNAGGRRIDIAPVFWAGGGDVANDVPPLLAALRAPLAAIACQLLPVPSELPGGLDFIAGTIAAH